ncbi:hypothetical protein SpCBS45565_g06788 [Spizellomyces sp. 'palustris']|nr:hypothetical protein SpCBS45565_g06788 [Spizellomyces sp. 'palustris']
MSKALRPASSIIICAPLRQGEHSPGADFRVLMLKRNARGPFGSLHVYPGGAVDAFDADLRWKEVIPHQDAETHSSKLPLSFWIAAIRETYEECGIPLLDPPLRLSAENASKWRSAVHKSAAEFFNLCIQTKSHPQISRLVHWCNWITPAIENSRFDTHFFLTVLEAEHATEMAPVVDGIETLALDWFTPAEALQAFREGRIHLFPPQYCSLLTLSRLRLSDLRSYMAGTKSRTSAELAPILPELAFLPGGETAMVLPGDPLHSSAAQLTVDLQDAHRVLVKKEKGRFVDMRLVRRVRGEEVGEVYGAETMQNKLLGGKL